MLEPGQPLARLQVDDFASIFSDDNLVSLLGQVPDPLRRAIDKGGESSCHQRRWRRDCQLEDKQIIFFLSAQWCLLPEAQG